MMFLPVALATLVVSLLPAAALQDGNHRYAPRAVNRGDPRPGVAETPLPPGVKLPTDAPTHQRASGAIRRNGFVVGRFTEQGQQVDYTFEAAAGELSLFDLGTWGYARSWYSTAVIQILDSNGKPLFTTRREGETAYRKFVAFVAPTAGVYHYRITAASAMFRYTLVRHSDYGAVAAQALAFGERQTVHGYLGEAGDLRTYAIELHAGEEVALRVANDHAMARKQKDNRRRQWLQQAGPASPEIGRDGRNSTGAAARGVPARGMQGRAAADGSARRAESPAEDFPDLAVQVSYDGRPIIEAAHFVLFTPEHDGTHHVVVTETSAGEGGLFVLELVRRPARVVVTGYVGDDEDDPVSGVILRFVREPASDVIGETRSDENGEFTMSVLPGKYSVHISREGTAATEIVPANIERARELNVVWTR